MNAMQTPDGRWRVEVVQHRTRNGFRILHDGDVVHGQEFPLGIGEVAYYLLRAGVDMADLVEVKGEAA